MRLPLGLLSLGLVLVPGLAAAAPEAVLVPIPDGVETRAVAATAAHLFFGGSRPGEGERLWQTDGTAEATHPVWSEDGDELETPRALTTQGAWLYFTASRGGGGSGLFRTDGGRVETLAEGDVHRAFAAEGRLFFTSLGPDGETLWTRGEGESASVSGPTLALDAPALAYGSKLLFAGSGPTGVEPWTTDGTLAGTSELRDVAPGEQSSEPFAFTQVGASATFFTFGTAGRLWRTDGTTAGTTEVRAWQREPSAPPSPRGVYGFARRLYFRARTTDGSWALWSSDGTPAGSVALAPLDETGLEAPLVGAGSKVFFVGRHAAGVTLFVSDGTAAGTVALVHGAVPVLAARGGRVYYTLDATHLGGTDGTLAGTASIEVSSQYGPPDGADGIFAVAAGKLFFSTSTSEVSRLWALPLPSDVTPVASPAAVVDAGGEEAAVEAEPEPEGEGCDCNAKNFFSPFLGLFAYAFARRRPAPTPPRR